MDADRTDPAIDAGPTCLYAVQTVEVDCDDCLQPPEACAECVDGLMFVRREDDVDYDPDECPRDVAEDFAVLYARRKVAKFRFIGWRREFGNKGQRRRNYRSLAKRFKRRSAMRRQGKGGGR